MLIDALQYILPSRAVFLQMREANMSAVHVTVGYHENFLSVVENLQSWNYWFEECGDLISRAMTHSDILAANVAGKTAILFGLQNPLPFSADLARVELLHQLGIRFCQITYKSIKFCNNDSIFLKVLIILIKKIIYVLYSYYVMKLFIIMLIMKHLYKLIYHIHKEKKFLMHLQEILN